MGQNITGSVLLSDVGLEPIRLPRNNTPMCYNKNNNNNNNINIDININININILNMTSNYKI